MADIMTIKCSECAKNAQAYLDQKWWCSEHYPPNALRTALAASQREREAAEQRCAQLESDNRQAIYALQQSEQAYLRLQARVEAAEKLIDKWRAVQNPTGAPVYQVYGFCADDLERALSPPAAPVQAEGES